MPLCLRALAPSILALAAGCQTTTISNVPATTGPRYVLTAPRGAPTTGLAAAILPVDGVPYDNRSLPLISPSGVFVATQTGTAPEWPTLLAASGTTVPAETRIEIYAIDRESAETRRIGATNDALLLGRGGDAKGFLVESPRPDGSRWIGRTSWAGGPVEWLVSDDRINAFACQGANGRLAWSRRSVVSEHFDLVLRTGAGEEWVIGAQNGDWLHPVLVRDNGLFAVRLLEGRLELAFMRTGSPQQMRSSLLTLPIANESNARTAYQMLASQTVMLDVPRFDSTHLLFWHPTSLRMALWRPLASPAAASLLETGSVAACIDASGRAIVGTLDHLALQNPANEAQRRVLVPGPQVPRPVNDPEWDYVLLAPRNDRIDLMLFRVLAE